MVVAFGVDGGGDGVVVVQLLVMLMMEKEEVELNDDEDARMFLPLLFWRLMNIFMQFAMRRLCARVMAIVPLRLRICTIASLLGF